MRLRFFVPGIWLLLVSAAVAQPPFGTVRGTVRDTSGTAVGGATVVVVERETRLSRSATTTADGAFAFSSLPAGRYQVEVEAAGHRKHVERFDLQVGQSLRADVQLEIGGVSESVVVEAPVAAVDRDTPAVGGIVDARQLATLPLDGRNFLDLTLLMPGTAPAAEGSASSVRGDFAFAVSGGREDANGFQLDGVDNVDPKLNTAAVRPSVDATREFRVQTSSYDAASGRYGAGQVSVVTRSGSNSLHGTAYGYVRDRALNARNYFAPEGEEDPEYSRQQFGGSLGGPIVADSLFFFANYEGMRLAEGLTQVTNVPTAAERAGDFSQSLSTPPLNPFTGQPFPGNRLPGFLINPIGGAIAGLYPLPNRPDPFSNFVSSPALEDRSDQFDLRIDRTRGGRLDLSARYSFSDRHLLEPFAGPAFPRVPGYGTVLDRRAQNLAATATSVLSSALVNELRFGYTRVAAGVSPENAAANLNARVGLPVPSDPRDAGLSFITVTGYSPLGDEYNNPQSSGTDAFQVADVVTWSRGAHLVKAGGDIRTIRQDAFRDVQARGFLQFPAFPSITGNALADLLLGLPIVTGRAALDNPQRLRTESAGFFISDSVHLGSSVTVTAGLRYEFQSPPVDADDRATVYDSASGTLVRVGTNGMPRSAYDADRNNWAPRAGLAWTVDRGARTVVRAGYGVYYNQSALAPSEGLYFSPPYFNFNLYFPLPGYLLTLHDPFPATYPLTLPDSAFAIDRGLRTPYYHQWSAGVERQLGRTRMVEIAYVGSAGRALVTGRDQNQPAPSTLPFVLRPNPRFDDIITLESAGHSRYDALQVRFEQRAASGLSLLASYTAGQSKDNASGFFPSAGDPNFPQDSRNLEAEYARSGFDVRHRLSMAFAYDLPFGRGGGQGWASALARDWQVSGILTVQSGRPFTVALLPEFDNSNTGRTSLGFGANDRPNQVGDPTVSDPSPDRWFDTGAFALPPRGSFGSAGRNTVDGPGYGNVSVAVMKDVRLPKDARLQIRCEIFNLFNRTNFDQPDNFFGSPTFGQVLSAQAPRRAQVGIRLSY